MNLIFIHPNFPAQFRSMAEHLGRHPDNDIRFVTANPRPEWEIKGVKKEVFKDEAPAQTLAAMQHRGEAVAKVLLNLRKQGFKPDIIVGASGWGSTFFVKDVFPEVPFLGYFEWYYDARLPNARFGRKEPVTLGGRMELRERSQGILSDLASCDHGLCPTGWQKAQFPKEFHPKLSVVHEGINTAYFKPEPGKKLVLPDLDLSDAKEIVTYTARGFEPYRGFPQFIESIPKILERRPNAHVVIVGQDRICYGPKLPEGQTYKKIMTEKVALDPERVHFIEPLPYGKYLEVLQASTVHVYLTVPFVLSWSLLEAMACGCLVVASDTQPVKEVIQDGVNGVLTPFFDTKKLAEKVTACLEYPSFMDKIRENARQTVESRYHQEKMLKERFRIVFGL
ncbi:MAG TPA: glycosyl transferase family 1, partial [Desulfobacteraceae bacterium]|nr:glycosyl transferase family 1 [Desulfobacteraceae bacterium]